MTLIIPSYIRDTGVAVLGTKYAWDEWNVNTYFLEVDEEQQDRLDGLSDAANLALAIGCGEWIYFN